MEGTELATLIVVTVVGGIGIIELIMWLVVIIRHPGFDDLRSGLVQAASTQPKIAGGSHGTQSSDAGK